MKIIVFSCDRYATIAPAFHHLLHKNWPGCPHSVMYVTNGRPLDVPVMVWRIKGEERAFGWRLRQFIEGYYADEHMLLLMVDYLIKGVDGGLVADAHQLCATPDIRHVRLRPMPHPQHAHPAPGFGCIEKGSRYSLSLQPGIWETQVLYDLCRDNEDPWQTEIQGSIRTAQVRGEFLSAETHAMNHHNYYRKRRAQGVDWVRAEVPEEKWPREARK